MAISVLQEPSTWTLADGRAFYELSTNNQFTNSGASHVFTLVFSSIPVNNTDMAFSYGAGAVLLPFIFKSSPDASGLQLPFSGGTIQFFVDSVLLPALEANAQLYADFSMESITNGVRLTARQKGAYYNTTTVTLGSGITRTTTTGGADIVERENFSLQGVVDVVRPTGTYQYLLSAYPYNNAVFVHLNKLLVGFYNRLAIPAFALVACADVSAAVLQFRVRWAEQFGTPSVAQKLGTDTWKYALPGGSSKTGKAQNDVFTYITNKLFLTRIRSQKIRPEGKAVLNYWHTSVKTEYYVRFTAVKVDGSSVNAAPIIKTGVARHSLWAIDCSPATVAAALGIAATDIENYTVAVVDQSGPGLFFSEFYPFFVQDEAARDYSQLLFQNSFGVYEFLELRGLITKNTSAKVERATLLKNNPARDEPVNHTLNKETLDSWQVSTGFLTRTEVEQLKEVLRSPDVYLVTPTHYQPINVTGHSKGLWDTDSGTLNSMELTLTQEQTDSYA
jgi:hypothetical protein